MENFALIVAGGRGSRFGDSGPKQYQLLAGKPIIHHTINRYLRHPEIDHIMVAIHRDDEDLFASSIEALDTVSFCFGGADRQSSVLNGLEALVAHTPARVLIHDAARPLVSAAAISGVLKAIGPKVGALAAIPVVDTLKRLSGETVDRTDLWRAQTPQGFMFDEILQAHRACAGQSLTDDTAVAQSCGIEIHMVESSEDNFKITYPHDMERAARLLERRESRTATGYDVHRIDLAKSTMMLCGVELDCGFGLTDHSNADVALHALTDALLGTIGAGDIGDHFPPSDEQWRGASSDRFLAHAGTLVRARDGEISNVDVTIVCERPKIGPHKQQMKGRIGEILNISPDRVSVKATTTEKLGATGRGEGIAAQASATITIPLMED